MSISTPPAGSAAPGPSSDAVAMMRYDADKKSAGVAYALWFFFGWFGAHRFYLGQTGTAVAQLILTLVSLLLTLVFVGIVGLLIVAVWVLVDAFLIPGLVRRYNDGLIDRMRR